MKIRSEEEMLKFGEDFAKTIKTPKVIELIGDVGAGKTTFTRGLAKGLGIEKTILSPSFSISREYAFDGGILFHYDLYRLRDPGITMNDLEEALNEKDGIVVVEWADSVKNILPEDRIVIKINYNEDGSREIEQ